jgi:IclR family transcriptional regulator, pca regulon regulatory protein
LDFLRDNRAMQATAHLTKADVIEGAVKAMAVLESFSAERQRLNATQVGERAGITRAAARRHLLTLHALGYLDGEGGSYWLAARVLRLAGNYLASARLPRVVQPMLNRFTAATHCATSVAVLDDADVVIVARSGEQRLASSALPFGTHLGARLPAFATSTGRVLLAQLGRTELASWLRGKTLPHLTPHTVCDKTAWKALVATVAAQGYCEAYQEHELGVQALAVPLRDSTGQVVAAMNVVLSVADVRAKPTASLVPQYLRQMQLAAEEVRQLL